MNITLLSVRIFLTLLVAFACTACSRTVEWEEEVPLNTGETIWVQRSGTFTFTSESGNPLDFAYRPEWRSTIKFKYKDKSYSHTSDAGLVLLAIAPGEIPSLVAIAAEYGWGNNNKYPCQKPYYVQFIPDATGEKWMWPNRISPQLYGLKTNLIFGLPPLASSGKKFTAQDREVENASSLNAGEHYRRIDPGYEYENCIRNK